MIKGEKNTERNCLGVILELGMKIGGIPDHISIWELIKNLPSIKKKICMVQ